MKAKDLIIGNYYIAKTAASSVLKIRVLETTKTTIRIQNENNVKWRELLEDFDYKYQIIEDLGNPDLEKVN